MKVIFHINELNKWDLLVDNIFSMIQYVDETGDTFDIVLVVNGYAVIALNEKVCKNLNLKKRILDLDACGIQFKASTYAMEKYDVDQNKLFDFIKFIPSGGLEITRKINEGYAYLKP